MVLSISMPRVGALALPIARSSGRCIWERMRAAPFSRRSRKIWDQAQGATWSARISSIEVPMCRAREPAAASRRSHDGSGAATPLDKRRRPHQYRQSRGVPTMGRGILEASRTAGWHPVLVPARSRALFRGAVRSRASGPDGRLCLQYSAGYGCVGRAPRSLRLCVDLLVGRSPLRRHRAPLGSNVRSPVASDETWPYPVLSMSR